MISRLVPRFLERFPKVEVEVMAENRFVNIVAEGLDAGMRLSEAIERDMVQVRLTGPGRFVVAAAPSYLARHGTPERPQDLLQHDCIGIRGSTAGAKSSSAAPSASLKAARYSRPVVPWGSGTFNVSPTPEPPPRSRAAPVPG